MGVKTCARPEAKGSQKTVCLFPEMNKKNMEKNFNAWYEQLGYSLSEGGLGFGESASAGAIIE
jgi:hypothetical protein